MLESSSLSKSDIIEFDRNGEDITNPVKCENIVIGYGEVTDVSDVNYKIKSSEGTTYSLPVFFFIPSEGAIEKNAKIRLYKNKVGVLVYGEIMKAITPVEALEEIYPETIGTKLPLASMKTLFKFNPKVQQLIDSLGNRYSSWRKIRGDGNCYFRAVGLGYLEYLCREATSTPEFQNFLSTSCAELQPILKNLLKTKLRLGSAVTYCQEVFQDPGSDEILVMEIRNRAANYIEQNSKTFTPFLTRPLQEELKMIKEMGVEAEGIACNYMGEILKVNIVSVILDREQVSDYKIGDNQAMDGIHLCLRGGHYDLLYSYQQDIEDTFGRKVCRENDVAYYIKSLHEHLRFIYEKMFKLGLHYDIRLGNYFPEFPDTLASFWKTFGRFQIKSQEIQQSCDDLYKYVSQNSFISEILGICRYCEERKASVRLSCGHLLCKEDGKNMIVEQTGGKCILGEGENEKVNCILCGTQLGKADCKAILGNEYKEYEKSSKLRVAERKRKIEEEQGIIQCKNCGSRKHISNFPLGHTCLCDVCFPKKIAKGRCPFCPKLFPVEVLKSFKIICAKCDSSISSPVINHSDHALCETCEVLCLNFNTCIICQKTLSASEESILGEKYYQSCFYCKSYFPAALISVRKCGCLLCNNCSDQSINFNSGHCVICNERLTVLKKACEICTEAFHRDEMKTLNCEHYFCEKCLLQYLVTQINSGLGIISCPSCNEAIDGFIIQNLVPGKMWDAYNKASIRKKFKLTDCPRCGAVFEAASKNTRCVGCKYKFCTLCKDPLHEGNCDDFKMKAVIAEIEKKGERVAQCPGCRSPYMKDEGCEHVACTNPACGVEFCFTCSCFRSPTLCHGNHYHREDCNFYAKYSGPDKESRDCTECKKYKKLCPRPKRLQNPRRFQPNES